MRWAIGRLLLATAAVLPLSGAFWIQPAHAAGPGPLVLKCGRFRGVMDVSPGFSDVPANQTISAQGRVDRCHGAGGGGTFVQMTGGSARRGMAKRGPWAATAFATRALTQSVAAELRQRKVHVALLIVDAVIAGRRRRR